MIKAPYRVRIAGEEETRIKQLEDNLFKQSMILKKVRDKSTKRRKQIDQLEAQIPNLKRKAEREKENAEAIKEAAQRAGVWDLVVDELKLAGGGE